MDKILRKELEVLYCSNCGGKISENDKFCPACGKEVKFELENSRGDKAPLKKKKHYVGIILLLIIIFACVFLAVLALTKVLPFQGWNIFSLQQTDGTEDHTAEIEESILEAEQYMADGNYIMAVKVLQEKNAEFGPSEQLETKLQDIQEAYAATVIEQAQEALDQEDYTKAIQLLKEGLTVLPDNETLIDMQKSAERLSKQATDTENDDTDSGRGSEKTKEDQGSEVKSTMTYTALSAEFKTYQGSIEQEDEQDEYQFTPNVTGIYRLDFSNMVNGFTVKLRVYNEMGEIVEDWWDVRNEDGITAELDAGQLYTIAVEEESGTGDYVLSVGMQKEPVDISDYDIVVDSTEYTDQINVYTFMPQNNGVYRFELSEVKSGVEMHLELFDALNYSVENDWVGNGGISAELQAGEQYTLEVEQSQETGHYLMHIGKQQATIDLSDENTVKDAITFYDQVNHYTFTPKTSGEYTIGIGGLRQDFEVYVTVTDSLGYDIEYDLNSEEDANMMVVSLEQGENYSISVKQRNNQGNYQIAIHQN